MRGGSERRPEGWPDPAAAPGVWLETTSMAWTLAVAAAAIAAGIVASSIALIGLGLESAIELLAAAIVVWQLGSGRDTGQNRAAGLICVTFLAAAAYLVAESIHELASHQQSAHSVVAWPFRRPRSSCWRYLPSLSGESGRR